MGKVTVEILAPLKQYSGNMKFLNCEGDTVGTALSSLIQQFPALQSQLFDSPNHLRDFINIFLNGEDIRNLGGIETKLTEGDKIMIMPAIAGGLDRLRSDRSLR